MRLEDDNRTLSMTFSARTIDGRKGPVPPDFDPWTADLEELLGSPPDFNLMFTSPMVGQALAAQMALRSRKAVEAGKLSVLEVLALAVNNGLQIPDWMADAFVSRYARFQGFKCRTLDEAFGFQPLKPRQFAAARRRRELLDRISQALRELIYEDPNRPIDRGLFEVCAERLNIGARQCEELYYEGVRSGLQDLRDLKKLLHRLKK
jgi:hypothetical protein